MIVRESVLEEIREYLMSLPSGARLRWGPLPASGRRRHPWPVPGPERAGCWDYLERCLRGMAAAAVLEVWPHGAGPEGVAEFDWPAAPGLFHEAESPAGRRAQENAPAAEGPLPELLAEEVPPPRAACSAVAEPPAELRLVRRPPKASRLLAGKLLLLLYARQQRATGSVLSNLLADAGVEIGRTTLEATLSWLCEAGQLTNARDGRGRGYGLARWDVPPDADDGAEGQD